MNPLSIFSSIFGVGAVGAGVSFGGYFLYINNLKKEAINNTNNISNPPQKH